MIRTPVGMTCKLHGFQYGRTRCKVCGYDPLKVSSPSAVLLGASLPRTGNGVGVLSSDLTQDQYQIAGDVIEGHEKILPVSEVETA